MNLLVGLPKLKFDDAALGLPRQPVPVRYACLAANWTPALLAVLVSHDQILAVHEADPTLKREGDVDPADYAAFNATRSLPHAEALAALPKNHFVWSDDLVQAFSDHIDLYLDRESAWADGLEIRWNPALGGCASVVSESDDLSFLNAPSAYRVWESKAIRNFAFEGKDVQVADSVGLRCVGYLLLHPNKPIPAAELYLRANPPVAVDISHADRILADDAATPSSEGETEAEDKQTMKVVKAHSSEGDEVIDDKGKKRVMDHLTRLREQEEDARERGDPEKAARLHDEMIDIAKHLRPAINKAGKSRHMDSDAERARKNVKNRIDRAIKKLAERHASLARHLSKHVKTGRDCVYHPPEAVRWSN